MAEIQSAGHSQEHLAELRRHYRDSGPTSVHADVRATCDLNNDAHLVRCLHPAMAYFGVQPVISYSVFEKWNGETWSSKGDL